MAKKSTMRKPEMVTKVRTETHSYPGLGKSCKRYYGVRPTVTETHRKKLGNATTPPKAPGVSY